MNYHENVLGLIGHTPLVKLNALVDDSMATVLAKLENLNPGGSVKDRMAFNMVRRAEEAGLIAPGATLVESTSGNTGLGLAMTAAVRGYKCICTMPDKMSQEKNRSASSVWCQGHRHANRFGSRTSGQLRRSRETDRERNPRWFLH